MRMRMHIYVIVIVHITYYDYVCTYSTTVQETQPDANSIRFDSIQFNSTKKIAHAGMDDEWHGMVCMDMT